MARKLPSGHTYEELPEEYTERWKKHLFARDGSVKLQPGGCVMSKGFVKHADLFHNFEVRPSDVFITGVYKSGTTWMQEIIWNMAYNPNLDNEDAVLPLDKRSKFFEGDLFLALSSVPPPDPEGQAMKQFQKLYPGKSYKDGMVLLLHDLLPSPRIFKTHFSLDRLPSKALETSKIIYIMRDLRDVLVSWFNYIQKPNVMKFDGTFEEFVNDFVDENGHHRDYWITSIKSAFDNKTHPNLCIVYYEDLKKDTFAEMKRMNEFLGYKLTDKQIENVIEHTSFSKMKERIIPIQESLAAKQTLTWDEMKTSFDVMKTGQSGTWKTFLNPEQTKKIEAWMTKYLNFGDDFRYKIE